MGVAELDTVDELLTGLKPTKEELAELKALERSNKPEELAKALIRLDKRQELWGLERIEALNPKLVNHAAFRSLPPRDIAAAQAEAVVSHASMMSTVASALITEQVHNDTMVPLAFSGLRVYESMSGPNVDDVRAGILGANRLAVGEYTITNPGDTTGKGRVPMAGQIVLSFSATLPKTARYCVTKPTGDLWIKGSTRVVGHGNSTTCFDSKVWVYHYMVVTVGGVLKEIAGGQVHYDGTRSEDRTKLFDGSVMVQPTYTMVHARAGDELLVSFRLQVETEANEDGIAICGVDFFGFPANLKDDYDSLVFEA